MEKEKESSYMLVYIDDNGVEHRISLKYVTQIGFGFRNGIVIYESVGEDGGYVEHTGRMVSTLSINLNLTDSLRNNLSLIERISKLKKPVYLASVGDKLFGQFLIESIDGNITEAAENVIVTINFKEYRQANVERVNLVVVDEYYVDAIVTFLRSRNLIG